MSYHFIAAVNLIDVSEPRRLLLFNDKRLTVPNDPLLDEILNYNEFIQSVGLISVEKLRKSHCLYTTGELNELLKSTGVQQIQACLPYLMEWFKLTIHCLWYVKDNSCTVSPGFWLGSVQPKVMTFSANFLVFNAKGMMEEVNFSPEEIRDALLINDKLRSFFSPKINTSEKPSYGKNGTYFANDVSVFASDSQNRIERANHLLTIARSRSELAEKISFYVNVLECLFSTSPNFVTTTVSKRAGHYFGGPSGKSIKKIVNLITEAYSVRSRFFHGDSIKISREKLLKLSVDIDVVLRMILRKAILKDSEQFLNEETLEEWFQILVPTKTDATKEYPINVPKWLFLLIHRFRSTI